MFIFLPAFLQTVLQTGKYVKRAPVLTGTTTPPPQIPRRIGFYLRRQWLLAKAAACNHSLQKSDFGNEVHFYLFWEQNKNSLGNVKQYIGKLVERKLEQV